MIVLNGRDYLVGVSYVCTTLRRVEFTFKREKGCKERSISR